MKESFRTVQNAIDYLKTLGYQGEYVGYCSGGVTDIDMTKGEHTIQIKCVESEEYAEYLETLPVDTEYETDFNKCEVIGFELDADDVVYPDTDYWGYEGSGIYIENDKVLLDRALELVTDRSKVVKEAYLQHFKNMDGFIEKWGDKLKEAGIVETYNSILDLREANSSNPTVCFNFLEYDPPYDIFYLWTDLLTGELKGDVDGVGEKIDEEVMNQLLRKAYAESEGTEREG